MKTKLRQKKTNLIQTGTDICGDCEGGFVLLGHGDHSQLPAKSCDGHLCHSAESEQPGNRGFLLLLPNLPPGHFHPEFRVAARGPGSHSIRLSFDRVLAHRQPP